MPQKIKKKTAHLQRPAVPNPESLFARSLLGQGGIYMAASPPG